jgi:hypothetical protein
MYYLSEILRFQGGTRSQHPTPEATVAEKPPGVPSGAGDLLVALVDLIPPLPHRSREIRALAVKTYWRSSGSVVARLRRAVAAANRHLVRANAHAEPGAKCAGSITCAAFCDDELFLGQVGAAYAFIHHPDGGWEVYPRRDRLLIPLGGSLPPMIHIGYTMLTPGSSLALATTPAAESQARERWQEALGYAALTEIEQAIASGMQQSQASGSFVLVSATSEPPALEARPPARRRPRRARTSMPKASPSVPAPRPRTDVAPPPADVEAPPTTPEAPPSQSDGVAQQDVAAPQPAASRQQPHPAAPATPPTPPSTALPAFLARRTAPEEPKSAPGTPPDAAAAEPRFQLPEIRLPSVRDWLRQRRERRRERRTSVQRTTAQRARLRQALRVLLPGKVEGAPQRKRSAPRERTSLMSGLTLGLTLLVMAITLSAYMRWGGAARAEELLVVAQSVRAEAFESQAPEDWRRLLDVSTRIITLDPSNAQAKALKAEAQQAIDALESAAVLDARPLHGLGTAPAPRRLLVADAWVYVLNTMTDEVIGLPLNPDRVSVATDAPTPIIKRGQTFYGEVVDHLVDLAWVRPGGTYPDGAVFIYSEGGALYIYEPTLGPGSITRQHIQGNLGAGMVTLMEAFGERIYLVHRQQNQILTYEPVNGIYEAPRGYFAEGTAPYLQEVVSLAIDGRIYLLMGDGEIQTYFNGTEDPSFTIQGLPDPDVQPLMLAVEPDPEKGLIYLGDPQHDRIVVLDKGGDFLHQFRLPGDELQRLEALAVSVEPHVLYLIADNQLYAAPLPSFVPQ